jgi:hypothetical protein
LAPQNSWPIKSLNEGRSGPGCGRKSKHQARGDVCGPPDYQRRQNSNAKGRQGNAKLAAWHVPVDDKGNVPKGTFPFKSAGGALAYG